MKNLPKRPKKKEDVYVDTMEIDEGYTKEDFGVFGYNTGFCYGTFCNHNDAKKLVESMNVGK